MTDNPPELPELVAVAAESVLPPSLTAATTELSDAPQPLEVKLSALQLFSQPAATDTEAAVAPAPLTINIQADASQNLYYYPAPDMTLHPMMQQLGLHYSNAYPMPYQPQYPLMQPLQPFPQLYQPPVSSPSRLSRSASPPRQHRKASKSLTQSHHGPVDPSTLRVPRVYVGNLAFSVGWQDLKDFFRNALGSVGRVELIAHPSGRSKGCAVVEFDSCEEAGRAINELNNAEIHGRKIFIREDREGKGFGAQSAQRAAAAAQASAAAAAAAGQGLGGIYDSGMGGITSAVDSVYSGPYGQAAAVPGGYAFNMQLYAQYLQQLQQQQQMRQQQLQQQLFQQQQQMEAYLPGQPQPSSPLTGPLQGMPGSFSPSPLPLHFVPSPSFLTQPPPSPYTLNRPFLYSPPSPTSTTTPSASGSPQPLLSPSSASSTSSSTYPAHPAAEAHSPRLLLSNLPFSFTRSQLYELTAQYSAQPVRCEIVVDGETGRSRGVGVAVYGSREECERVVDEMKGLVVGERKVHVRRDEYSS